MHAGFFYLTSLGLAASILVIIGAWKTFQKAGEPGWAALIPIYNYLVILRIVSRPWWWILLIFIPLVNLVIHVIVNVDIAKAFGKGTAFGLGIWLLPFVFFPILGLGEARYTGRPLAQ
jgi:hypothetical protein